MSNDLTVLRDFPLTGLSSTDVAAIERMTVAQLRHALAESLATTAASLLRLALIVRLLEERGEDVSDLRLPLLTYLRLIAHGQLLPDLVARFAENPPLIRQLSYLPIATQRSLAAGEAIRLVVRNGDGYTHRLAEPSKLDMGQRNQVFARDHVRSDEEQILWLEGRKTQVRAEKPRGRVRPDPDSGGLIVGRARASRADVLSALAQLAEPEDEGAERVSPFVVKLTEAEHKKLRIASAQDGVTMQDLGLRALRAFGLI